MELRSSSQACFIHILCLEYTMSMCSLTVIDGVSSVYYYVRVVNYVRLIVELCRSCVFLGDNLVLRHSVLVFVFPVYIFE